MEHYRIQLEEVNQAIGTILPEFHCTLMTMPGIDIITVAYILSEIGNISRFPKANKLAKFIGIALVNFLSAGKGKDMCLKQAVTGNLFLSGNPDDSGIRKRNTEK